MLIIRVDEVTIDEPLIVLLELVLPYQAHGGIVEQYYVEGLAVIYRCHYLHAAHLKAAVTQHRKTGFFRIESCASGGGYSMPEGGYPGVRIVAVATGNPEKVLCKYNIIIEHLDAFGVTLLERREKMLHQPETCMGGIFPVQGIEFPLACRRIPVLGCGAHILQPPQTLAEHLPDITLYGQVCIEYLFQLPRVIINLDDLLSIKQFVIPQVAGSLVEACAQKQNQVGLIDNVLTGLTAGGHSQAAQG